MSEEVGLPIRAGNTQMEFTNTMLNRRKLRQSVKNPLDKCTIVSIYPKAVDEEKATIQPGKFHIDKGSPENPSILVVGGSSWWKDIDPEQDPLEMPRSSVEIADSIITDYCNSLIGVVPGSASPGLFFITGEKKLLEVKTSYKDQLKIANEKQNNWYQILVRLADSLWARANGNPLVIMDDMRLAARSLNLNEKAWLKDYQTIEKVPCKGCGTLKDPNYPICYVCKTVDTTHPSAKDLKFSAV
jgi:hypothetical protein